MPSFTAWYSQQYASWNRTRRLRASPYLATAETQRATALATGTANALSNTNDIEANPSEPPNPKKQETLFGPNIGIVSDGPAWAQSQDAMRSTPSDGLTPETVKRWMEMSKESVQPTTTLQALVNLKRPTLRLSPLQAHPSDDSPDDLINAESHNNHALEFEYDCDAPKCCIKVQVIIPSKDPNPHGSSHPISERITVYESAFDGGFGRLLKLEDGATIDLGRFKHPAAHGGRVVGVDRSSPKLDKNLVAAEMSEQPEVPSQSNTPVPDQQDNVRKRRFTGIYFRRRSHVSGPALAVVDDAAAATESGEKGRDVLDDDGIRVAIQLVALDDFGKELSSVNRQSTYLHVVRLGLPVTSGEDNRSWVVKVVKREATIGPHTFHLHEIYGLSSSAQPTPSAINPTAHTYPPVVAPVDDEPSSECLVCLSSPREVVLLPCRHLVACKECAVNMIEFGAGGAIMHTEEPTTTTEPQPAETVETPAVGDTGSSAVATGPAGEDVAAAVAVPEGGVGNADSSAVDPSQVAAQPARNEEPVAPSAPAPSQAGPTTAAQLTSTDPQNSPPQQNPRRKRRAKGWSCPVCRQPYTSLLRITTTPPTIDGGKEGKRVSTSTIDHPLAVPPVPVTLQTVTPALEMTLEEPATPAALPSRSLRPVFLRALSRRPADPVSPV
ncbi:hypothetical protein BC827DRAFT_1195313 [Russula dissimulans]|nr:hypothetical protein BC827DRAFT_1195313 [Russula dissimulans]